MMSKKSLTRIICLSAMVLTVLFQGCASTKYEMEAQISFENRDFDSAVEKYTKAVQENPDDLDLQLRLKDSKQKASLDHMNRAVGLIDNNLFTEAIEELQLSIAFYASNYKAVALMEKAKRMKESLYYAKKAEKQIRTGDFKNARKSFHKAVELNPDNREAAAALEKFKKSEEELSEYRLDLKSDEPISLKFKKTPILNVFEIFSKITGVNFIFDKDTKETKVTLFMTDVKFEKFLDVVLKTNGMKAKVINRKTMLIYPDTPAKAKEYDELYVKTFYLSHLKAKNALIILTKILKSKDVIANEKLNAITIRGQRETVGMAEKIILANDRTPSEVVMNVEIMEVSREKEKDLGLSISESITFGISETSSGINNDPDFGLATWGSFEDISKLSRSELYLSLPTATLKLLKKDGDTKILAKPQLRVSSSEKAAILIGEKVPIRSNRKVQTDGTTTYDFQYQDVGVKLAVEPVINMYDQISLKIQVEISALGNNVGTLDDPQYAIKTRSADTVLTLNDGDNVIIGGLIEDTDRSTIQRIPLLGDMPAMGRLFSSESSEAVKTDILMSITPVIIRPQDIPEDDIAGFWSGSEKEVSLATPVKEKIIEETNFNDIPETEYIRVTAENEFLPGDNYFSIQVYSSTLEQDALEKKDTLELLGHQVWVRSAQVEGRGEFYRVFIGQYMSYQDAEEARLKLLKSENFPRDIIIVDRAYVYGR